jgi:FkbM family methyltransferase
MYKNLKKLIGYYLFKENNIFEDVQICGVSLKVLKGAVPKKADYDDAWFFHLAKHSENFFDIGSNIGYMSLLAALQRKTKNILLVDPNPEALARASQNLIINGFGEKVKFITGFVGDKQGEKVKFYTVGSGAAGSMYKGHAVTASAANKFYYVAMATIDSLVEKVGYLPDLIKIDVEGAESLALKGASKTASFSKTKFMVEMHSFPELTMLENATLVLNWCVENGYKAYYMSNSSEIVDPETISGRGRCHVLLLPKSESYPGYLMNISQGAELPRSLD